MITMGVIGGGYWAAYDIISETIENIVPSATVSEPNENMEATVPPTTTGEEIENVEEYIPTLIGKNNSVWGWIIGCTHTPHKYYKNDNVIKCECRKNKFSGQDMANLSYNQFVSSYIRKSDIRFKDSEGKKAVCVESYLTFMGVDPVFLDIANKIALQNPDHELDDAIAKVSALTSVVGLMEETLKADAFYAKVIDDNNALPLIESAGKANEILGKALTVTEFALHLSKMVNCTDDPAEGCTQFIMAVKAVVPDEFYYFADMLDALQQSLDMFWTGVKNYEHTLKIHELAFKDGGTPFARDDWSDFGRINYLDYWDRLTYDHIMGITDKQDRELLLPSLPEILEVYDTFNDEEKAFAQEYMLFCLDRVFEEAIGFTYQEYISYLGK